MVVIVGANGVPIPAAWSEMEGGGFGLVGGYYLRETRSGSGSCRGGAMEGLARGSKWNDWAVG